MTNVIEELAEDFERMHANGDAWVTTIAVAAKLRQAIAALSRPKVSEEEVVRIYHETLAATEMDTQYDYGHHQTEVARNFYRALTRAGLINVTENQEGE